MTQAEFERIIGELNDPKSMRGRVYPSALNLIRAGFIVEAHLLLLATWNFARFRYVVTSFDLPAYEKLLRHLQQKLRRVIPEDFDTIDFGKHQSAIIQSFASLAAVRGIEFTGASKVLHLLSPRVFVMWDSAISGWYTPKADYAKLNVVRSSFWKPPKYPFARSGVGYYDFLIYCQSRFNGLVTPDPEKTFARCIDEFNYRTISQPLLARKRLKMKVRPN
jgi:hypothetical protein